MQSYVTLSFERRVCRTSNNMASGLLLLPVEGETPAREGKQAHPCSVHVMMVCVHPSMQRLSYLVWYLVPC